MSQYIRPNRLAALVSSGDGWTIPRGFLTQYANVANATTPPTTRDVDSGPQ